ncbi:MAG: Mov34/MPN/PAD-1 family protein [Chloroflexota bacterium]|nr:Mov34/MPN/PAD-1 family protein [Chloroflexota bacterium]
MAQQSGVPGLWPRMIVFRMGVTAQPVYITDAVIDHVRAFRQLSSESTEAGGGIFITPSETCLTMAVATGPYESDIRTRTRFRVDATRLNDDIGRLRQENLYFVGMWHTHPEDIPRPSHLDLLAMRHLFRVNDHGLVAMLLMIVGRLTTLNGLSLSLHTENEYERVPLSLA